MKKEAYNQWVNEAMEYLSKIVPIIHNISPNKSNLKYVNIGSTQYIPTTEGDIEFVFLGHDAHEGFDDKSDYPIIDGKRMLLNDGSKERFFNGNSSPYEWRKRKEWKIWNNIERAFNRIGFTEIIENGVISDTIIAKTIVTNALLFNYTGKADELNRILGNDVVNDCMKLTAKLIFEVIRPKVVICSSCNLVFLPLLMNYDKTIKYERLRLEGTKKVVMRSQYNGVQIVGIPHTSYPVPNAVAKFVREVYMETL